MYIRSGMCLNIVYATRERRKEAADTELLPLKSTAGLLQEHGVLAKNTTVSTQSFEIGSL
jgi:hypothetical protein